MSIYYAECKSKKVYPDYEGARLTCHDCGLVGCTEPITQDEVGDLANFINVMTVFRPKSASQRHKPY